MADYPSEVMEFYTDFAVRTKKLVAEYPQHAEEVLEKLKKGTQNYLRTLKRLKEPSMFEGLGPKNENEYGAENV